MQRFFPVMCAALGIGAAALGALQYQWAAELRRLELERLRFSLRSAGASFVREVSAHGDGQTGSLEAAAARFFRDSPPAVALEVREARGGALRFRAGADAVQSEPALVLPFSLAVGVPSALPKDVMVRVPLRQPELELRMWTAEGNGLDAIVDRHRNRNLALSWAALLLVVAAGGVALHTARAAMAAERRQVEMAAAISHELKTPVAVIRSAAQNLSSGIATDSEQVRHYGELMDASAQRLAKTIARVSTIAAAPRRRRHWEVVDVGALLSGLGDVEVRCAAPMMIRGDADALRAALEDLVSNARKHAYRSSRVTIRAEKKQDGHVLLAVEDDGPGIPESELTAIFEPFRRGARAVRDRVEGSGLGLYLVASVARAHGGEVRVKSSVEGGSVFALELPEATA